MIDYFMGIVMDLLSFCQVFNVVPLYFIYLQKKKLEAFLFVSMENKLIDDVFKLVESS